MQITRKHLIGTLAATSLIAGTAVPVVAQSDTPRGAKSFGSLLHRDRHARTARGHAQLHRPDTPADDHVRPACGGRVRQRPCGADSVLDEQPAGHVLGDRAVRGQRHRGRAHVDDHRCGYVHGHGSQAGNATFRSGDQCGADGHDQQGSDDPDPPTGLAAGVAAEVPGQVHRGPDLAGHRSADPRSDDHLQRVALRDGAGSLHGSHRQHRTGHLRVLPADAQNVIRSGSTTARYAGSANHQPSTDTEPVAGVRRPFSPAPEEARSASGPGGRDPGSSYRFSGSPEDMIQTPER